LNRIDRSSHKARVVWRLEYSDLSGLPIGKNLHFDEHQPLLSESARTWRVFGHGQAYDLDANEHAWFPRQNLG